MTELGRPPEFGRNGEDPPRQSPLVLVAEDFYAVPIPRTPFPLAVDQLRDRPRFSHPDAFVDVTDWLDRIAGSTVPTDSATKSGPGVTPPSMELAAILGRPGAAAGAKSFGDRPSPKVPEIRRIRLYKRWVRDDPITQLAPGSSAVRSVEVTVGVSRQKTRELGSQLGIGKLTPANLNAQLSARIAETMIFTEQRKMTHSLTLDNSASSGRYRRFAIWHPEDTIEVSALRLDSVYMLTWTTLAVSAFAPAEAVVLTFADGSPG